MPEGEDREALEAAAGEQVEEADGTLALGAVLELLDRQAVDTRHADGDAEAVDDDHQHREQDLVPEVGDLEDVLQVGEHAASFPL